MSHREIRITTIYNKVGIIRDDIRRCEAVQIYNIGTGPLRTSCASPYSSIKGITRVREFVPRIRSRGEIPRLLKETPRIYRVLVAISESEAGIREYTER